MADERTPEWHHDRLVEEIEYELATWGPRSLAAVIATLLEDDGNAWAHFAPKFRRIEEDD